MTPCRLGLVTQNCVLTADLNQVPKESFKKKTTRAGKEYVEIHYKLVVAVAAKMTFALQVGGKEISQVGAEY